MDDTTRLWLERHDPHHLHCVDRDQHALRRILQWCEAYELKYCPPIPEERLAEIAELLQDDMGKLHAGWARHLLDGIAKIAREALDD